MRELVEGTLADLHTLMGNPVRHARGSTQLTRPPSPAAGQTYTYKVPPDWWVRLVSVTATLTTTASGIQRNIDLALADGDGAVFFRRPFLTHVQGNQTVTGQAALVPTAAPVPAMPASVYQQATTPAAATQLAQTFANYTGWYKVQWSVKLGGTLTAGTDDTNLFLTDGSSVQVPAIASPVAGVYNQDAVTWWLNNGQNVHVSTTVLATTGAIYGAKVTLLRPDGLSSETPLPDVILKSGWQVLFPAVNLQAGDQLGSIALVVEQYPSNWADGALGEDAERQVSEFLERHYSGYGPR